ncbi:hypothetical protein FOA52_011006 [Chlamydomonas sp. UWO 241]|nr:hypothetical protein FOA52_011006 [Chlamydomonas sp. UWO 241]
MRRGPRNTEAEEGMDLDGLQALADAAAAEGWRPQGPVPQGEGRQRSSSRFIGVTWNKSGSSWGVQLWDPLAKRNWHIGSYATEEDAAKAYDCAAVQVNGPGARRNFPEELISEPPPTMGEKRKQRSSSLYTGVTWSKAKSAWHVQMTDPVTKRNRHIGYFDVENKAARAYDCAAVQAHGAGAKRNFPGEPISELELAASQKKKQRSSSQYVGVSWSKTKSSWHVRLWDPETKRERHIGCFTSEEDAARAYDRAAVQSHGPDAKRNFPGEGISELPASLGLEPKQRGSSRFIGVSWNKARSSWLVQVRDPVTKTSRHIGRFASEEDAARAYDDAAVQLHGPGAKRNFPTDAATSELPAAVNE